MKNNSLVDVAKHQNKLRKIVALNEAGAIIFTDKTAMALYGKVSKSEFINAFKADVEKTATYLIDSLGIINSIKNGLIQELDSLDNSVESFFGETYKDGVITLSGVEFIPGAKAVVSRSEIIDTIYNKLFEIDRKSLNYLARTLERYETSTSDIEKALLYPSTVMADKLIEKIGLINHKFEEFRGKLSYEELEEFTSTFNRSGITDVIQASTYVDIKGVRQIANSHKSNIPVLSEISESLKASKFKYIQALELDADSDVRKVFNVISQIERLKINIKEKFVLKFRKLGNYNARGLCINTLGIVAEDVRDSSALIHEIAHYVHLSNMQIFESKFVNYMIDKLTQRVDLNNVPVVAQSNIAKKETYYLSREEVIARALEIAALFANETSRVIWSEADLDLIKSRSFYEEYEGIYFNFNSFDEETKDYMVKMDLRLMTLTQLESITGDFGQFKKRVRELTPKAIEKELIHLERVSVLAAVKGFMKWDYEKVMPERMGQYKRIIKPVNPVEGLNGSFIIGAYECRERNIGVLFFYNIYREEYYGELRAGGIPVIVHQYDATTINEFSSHLKAYLEKDLETLYENPVVED